MMMINVNSHIFVVIIIIHENILISDREIPFLPQPSTEPRTKRASVKCHKSYQGPRGWHSELGMYAILFTASQHAVKCNIPVGHMFK